MIITVDLGPRGYDVIIESGARHRLSAVVATRAPRARAAVVVTTEALVGRPWFDVTTGLSERVVTVPDGEAAKTPSGLAGLVDELAAAGLSRDDVVVAAGGGALTDLVGFAAAVYRRGVAVIHVPTTLVGQADAAIGGKSAVNLTRGKNLMGVVHQPVGVLCDLDTLATLAPRELRSGLAEVAKCWILESRAASAVAATGLEERVAVAAALKAAIVSDDEHESGRRALLNYGHTLAHAMEALARERGDDLRHGEAVAVGLAFAPRLARSLGRVDDRVVAEHDAVLAAFGLDPRPRVRYATDDLVAAMRDDKKSHHDLTFVLPGPRGFEVVADVDATGVGRELEHLWGVA